VRPDAEEQALTVDGNVTADAPGTPAMQGDAATTDPDDVTIATYEASAERYRARHPGAGEALTGYLDRFAALVGTGRVLELGSGTGWDAAYLEGRGVRVERTDVTPAFLDMLRADGHEARLLDARTDDLGGPHDGILADAVLLHLSREQFADVLARARRAIGPTGALAITLKEGDGEGWSDAKLSLPRHFTYWRAPDVRVELARAGWETVSLEHVDGHYEPWLYVIARPL
jgi:SAM-dependent methyltransferase